MLIPLKSLKQAVLLFFLTVGMVAADERVFKTVGLIEADYPTVQAAIDAVPAGNREKKLILIQPGAYFGHTVLNKPNVTLRGSGPSTLLTYNLGQAIPGNDMQPVGWQGAAALLITAEGQGAAIENLTIENTYGKGMQAQACSSLADRVAFRRCRIMGWQDTLKIDTGRHYFENCYITGHVDFIYGSATAYFTGCEINCREPGYIVAPSTLPGQTGFVFDQCRITFPFGNPSVYMGRPWRDSPSATFVRCELGAGIRPQGWQEWNVKPPLVRFAEYACTGPGAATAGRVDWVMVSSDAAPVEFSKEKVLGDWKP
ncbi:MAG: pectinesterase family protein [Verrucomicrobiota bacterium]